MSGEKRSGRPRLTAAEQREAYRQRKKAELQDPDLPERDVEEDPATPTVSDSEPDEQLGISLQAYVDQIKKEASEYADAIGEDDKPVKIPGSDEVMVNRKSDRIARAEKYARWRYQGVLDGEVSSL